MNIHVAIIEDEPATARQLKYMLEEQAEVSITVKAMLSDVDEAVDWLSQHARECQLLFMDIRLANGLSFSIFQKLQISLPVIFVTAYHEYALEAFRANGIDYILKPFSPDDIARALTKFSMLRGTASAAAPPADLLQALRHLQQQHSYRRSLLVQYRDKLIPLAMNDIHFFYSRNEVLHACTAGGQQYMVEGTLEKMQPALDPDVFFRANRQYIVNRKAISEVNFYFNGRLMLKVLPAPPEPMLISKARAPEFREWMNR